MQTIIRANELVKRLGISRTTLWRLTRNDTTFPQPMSISNRTVGWIEAEVDAWILYKRNELAKNNLY